MLYLVTECRDFKFNADSPRPFSLADDDTCRTLMHNVMKHDRSKFSTNQFLPYIELTEFHHQRKTLKNENYDYPNEEIKKQVDGAIQNHYYVENHHPEGHTAIFLAPNYFEIAEIVCDLQAMAQEFNEGSCRGFFENIWVKKQADNFKGTFRWDEIKTFMREVISLFERKIDAQ